MIILIMMIARKRLILWRQCFDKIREVDKDDNEKNLSENAVDCIYEDDDFNFIDFLQK